jgi:hypothetical protein
LVSTEFTVNFLEPTSVNACADNVLYPLYTTKAGNSRDDMLEFTIGSSSGSVQEFLIDGLAVEATVSTCKLVTTLEYMNPYTNIWEEWKPNDYTNIDDLSNPTSERFPGFTLMPTQTNYADSLVHRFMTGPSITLVGYVPESV